MLFMPASIQINSHDGFNARLKKVQRSHSKLARGYSASVGRDGLIVFRPKRRRPGLPLRGIALALIAFFGFKALILMQLGETSYQARASALAAGNFGEQVGAWMMQLDPITRAIAAQIAPLI